jgi:predicted ArsR family transcriptional regulator
MRWTKKEVETLISSQDLTIDEVVKKLGRPKKAIESKMSYLRKKGMIPQEFALKRAPRKLTDEQINLILTADMTIHELAKELGVTTSTISYYKYDLRAKRRVDRVKKLAKPEPDFEYGKTYKTPVRVAYDNKNGVRHTKDFILNEKFYHKACERIVDMLEGIMKYKNVEVVE